ncbi:MAG: AhpC/TSA family protein [Alphaproteobacteria bacterium]|nr:AhpC/TSA family protein [Alphaproteobacteria bacterium]
MDEKKLSERLAEVRARSSARSTSLYDALVKKLIDSGAMDGALMEGATFPDFQLASADGRFVRRADVLAHGPAVVSFYRGAWCPYCSAELNALAQITQPVQAVGANLVAITPEAGGIALRTKVDRGFAFEILCDLDNVLAAECGLVFPVPDDVRKAYLENKLDLALMYGNDAWMLPTPATYVVQRDGVIAKAYVNPDFRFRLEPAEILAALAALR